MGCHQAAVQISQLFQEVRGPHSGTHQDLVILFWALGKVRKEIHSISVTQKLNLLQHFRGAHIRRMRAKAALNPSILAFVILLNQLDIIFQLHFTNSRIQRIWDGCIYP